jgi:hypothetical protein
MAEYRIEQFQYGMGNLKTIEALTEAINSVAAEGWKLVFIDRTLYYFEREK